MLMGLYMFGKITFVYLPSAVVLPKLIPTDRSIIYNPFSQDLAHIHP